MSKIATIIFAFSSLIFFSLFYNYYQNQKKLSPPTAPTILIDWFDSPAVVTADQPAVFKWQIKSPADLKAITTSIYWSYDSSPSALTTESTPEAVRYTNSTPDYTNGPFFLPDIFDARIKFPKPGKVFLRAYAQIGDRHFWTKEIEIYVKPQ